MGYKLTHRAEQDLIDIYVEGFRLFGDAQAETYAGELRQAFELLAQFPGLARERAELVPPVRIYPSGSHVIIYLITDDGDVLVVRIRHGREDWQRDPVSGA